MKKYKTTVVSGMDDSIFNLEYADSVPLLTKAVRAGDLEKIKKLIKQGWLPQMPDNRGWTAIHCCVAENQLKALKLILKLQSKSKKYLVNLTTWENVSPLHIALKTAKPSLKLVKILLEAGADPKQYTHTKLSPMHLACMRKGSLQFVKLLVEFGADVNIQEDLCLFTPLHVAICKSCDLSVIKYLLNLSDLSLKNNNNRTAFLEACNSNFLKAVELFLKKDKNLANIHYGIPPLAYAGIVGNLEMTQVLINSGADVNLRCKAIITCKESDSEVILLDRENFLPIHSSLINIEVFKLFLKLTKSNVLLQLETNYCSFPLFVMIYGGDSYFEALLQSDLPNKLKTICSQVLIKFILSYPDMIDIVIEKFQMIFKYNFGLEPENVLQSFVSEISALSLWKYYKFYNLLAQMGISSQCQCKNNVIDVLKNYTIEGNKECVSVIKSTCDLLLKSVLSLKQYCRIVLRRQIRIGVESDWLALKMVEKLELPDLLKKFVLFECIS